MQVTYFILNVVVMLLERNRGNLISITYFI